MKKYMRKVFRGPVLSDTRGKPDLGSQMLLLNSCAAKGDHVLAEELWEAMQVNHKFVHGPSSFYAIFEAYVRAKQYVDIWYLQKWDKS